MLYGRDVELARIDALLEGARESRSGVLVLLGEPGVGKSRLLAHAVERAEGMRVLRAVGLESESELAFAGLYQLLRPVLAAVERLPVPQRAALTLRYLDGLPVADVAEHLGRTLHGTETLLARSRAALRRHYQQGHHHAR